MATKIQSLLKVTRRGLEVQDVLAAFQRAAQVRWGERLPPEPLRYARGTLTVRCRSPLWRTELLFSTSELRAAILHELPPLNLSRIVAVLD